MRIYVITALWLSFLSGSIVHAQDAPAKDSQGGYQFNDLGEAHPETSKPLQFKIGSDTDNSMGKAEQDGQGLYRVSVGYPKHEVIVLYQPGYNGFKNILSDAKDYAFNFGGVNFAGGSLAYRYNPSLENFFTISLSGQSVSVPAFQDTSTGYNLKASTALLTTLQVAGNFCSIYESAFHRLCPGVELSLDSYPSLDFGNSNSDISLSAIRDITLGANVEYFTPLFGAYTLVSRAALDLGFGLGQDSKLGVRSDQKISGSTNLEWPCKAVTLRAGVGLDYRLADVKSNLDEWKSQNLNFNANLGFRYEWAGN